MYIQRVTVRCRQEHIKKTANKSTIARNIANELRLDSVGLIWFG